MKTSALRMLALGLLLWFGAFPAAHPAASTPAPFDHQTTGFELDGAHRDLSCESCHINAVFKGTPSGCAECHSRGTRYNATPKPANHILSSEDCVACHNTTSYQPVVHFSHAEVRGSCASCHNNVQAQGKPSGHIATTQDCSACHSSVAWTPAAFDHAGVTTGCYSCHNGSKATGKNAAHLPTSNSCESCHNSNFWKPSQNFDHAQTAGTCVTCHSGAQSISTGALTGKPSTHPITPDTCANCHTTVAWLPVHVDHTGLTTGCVSCHNGAAATGKSPTHLETSDNCASCHGVASWTPALLPLDHTQMPAAVSGLCTNCHNGALSISTGTVQGKPNDSTHQNVTAQCGVCHSTTTWLGAGFNHAGITTGCVSCHNGTAATGKNAGHLTTSNNCESCHSTSTWKPAIRFDHTQTTVPTCFGCHNGTTAISTGAVTYKPANHIAADNGCEACHTTAAWKPANFSHAGVTGNCVSCHFPGSTTATTSKPTTHILTSNTCENCHSVVAWKPATQSDHTQMPASVAGNCTSCHSGTLVISTGTVQGKPADSIHQNVTAQCGTCHSTTTWLGAAFSHTGITSGCASCHNGSTATGKGAKHLSTTNLCENCHTTTAWQPARTFDHTQTSATCYTCHSGAVAISTGYVPGKTATHIATSNDCAKCHNSTNWNVTAVDHTQIPAAVAGSCISCHNGTNASGKPVSGHVTTSAECGACHSTLAWTPATFSHTGIDKTRCASCHDGLAATGKPAGHMTTSRDCSYCHTSTTAWTPLTFKHTSPNYPGDHRTALTCTNSSCHGTNSDTVVTWRNSAYANSCAGCHASNYRSDPHTKYGSTKYTVSELRNCSGACHIYTDATLTTIKTRRNGPQHRVTSSGFGD